MMHVDRVGSGPSIVVGSLFNRMLILIKGAGDLASGVAVRLHRAGFPVVMTELAQPLAVRRSVAFAQAVFSGRHVVEGVAAYRSSLQEVDGHLRRGAVPVLIDPAAECRRLLAPVVLVDGIMAKCNTGTRLSDARLVVALGPGFAAGLDCHAVVETNRGHDLGRVIWRGAAQADTGKPGALPGLDVHLSRVLRAPLPGHVHAHVAMGQRVAAGQLLATVYGPHGAGAPVTAPFAGIVRGIIHPRVPVTTGMKIGDLDPRARAEYCRTISDKSLAIGGGVLEAILHALRGSQQPAVPFEP